MTSAGFPHSDIHGSSLASSSPWLFAGSRVLHRLLSPRHPSCALSTLTSRSPLQTPEDREEGALRQAPYSHNGVRVELRGSFRHLALSHIHSACRSAAPPSRLTTCDFDSLVVFKSLELSKIALARSSAGLAPLQTQKAEAVEDTGIEPVTSSLQSWRSPS
jgi:hypothetical protein